MTSPDVIVVGAGVLGLASAAELAGRGLAVTVIDPGGPNASSVAAGMIAPAMESVLDDLAAETVAVLKAARALWPDFAARHGLTLIPNGATWRGPGADRLADRLLALGFAARRATDAVHASDDARIDPTVALARLGLTTRRVQGRVERLNRSEDGWVVTLEDRRGLTAPHLVLATGTARAIPGLSPRTLALIEAITPIRGQLAVVAGAGPATVTRMPEGYAVPVAGGMIVGASMDAGRRDLTPDLAAARAQVDRVCACLTLKAGEIEVRVGIRGASPDGLPIVGALDGVHLALAPRRNGWLLAPLVARVVADSIQGRPPVAGAAALDPARVSPAAG